MCSPNTRAASTKIGSFSRTSACSGVFEFTRLTVHSSRVGASKVDQARMQEGALPEGVDAAPVQIVAVAGRVFALRKIQRRQIAIRLVRPHARAAELLDQQSGDLERDVAHRFRIHAEPALPREQAVVGIALVELRRGSLTIADRCGW